MVADGGTYDLKSFLLHQSSKPFTQKTEREKDELYEHIAGQLATIAYNYTSDSPSKSTTKQKEATEAATGMKAVEVGKFCGLIYKATTEIALLSYFLTCHFQFGGLFVLTGRKCSYW